MAKDHKMADEKPKSKSSKLYSDSPTIERGEDGKVAIKKKSAKADSGSDANQSEVKEPGADGQTPDVMQEGERKSMVKRHIEELGDMHDRHLKDLKELSARHNKKEG